MNNNLPNSKKKTIFQRMAAGWWWLGLLLLAAASALFFSRQQPAASGTQAQTVLPPPPRGVVPVQVQKTATGYRLLRGGKPYWLKGAGGLEYYHRLRAAGGNSVRLWSTDYAAPLLDEAQRQNLTVMLGLWLEPEDKHFTYHDPKMVAAQRHRIREQVLRYRNHPALLMWSVGNEVEQTAYGPRMFVAVNEIARMIHELDPYHPVTIALANDFIDRAKQLQRVAPDVDILSINVYDELRYLPLLIKHSQWQGPYIVSEFGCIGYWQTKQTSWRSPLEPTSGIKADSLRLAYPNGLLSDSTRCLGGYAFYWGNKFEYTPTWLSLFAATGEKNELVDELQRFWSGSFPANRAPHLTALRLPGLVDTLGAKLQPGQRFMAAAQATDPEGDTLTAQWEIREDRDLIVFNIAEIATPTELVPNCLVRPLGGLRALLQAPQKPGLYRLFVRVYDGRGSIATANIPLLVGPEPNRKSLPYSLLSTSN